jgi:hypothetical protein
LLQAGADWFACRSTNAVMQAVREAGVPFNMIVRADDTIECLAARAASGAPWRRSEGRSSGGGGSASANAKHSSRSGVNVHATRKAAQQAPEPSQTHRG